MFLPIGDSPNLPKAAWVTWGLIAANVLVFLACAPLMTTPAGPGETAYDLVVDRHGFKPAAPSIVDAVTSMFLHGGLMHLLGNMLFLWIFGDNVEHRLGRLGFLAAYLATGLAAALGDALLRFGSDVPAIGASGAISGVLGFYFIWFPFNRVRVWVILFPYVREVELPARIVLGIYIVVDNILPALFAGGRGSVSYGAHIGGFVAGCAVALLIDRAPLAWRREIRAATPPPAGSDPLRAIGAALAAGEPDRAARLFFALPPAVRRAADPELVVGLGEALEEAGRDRAALAAYQRALADHPHGPGRARAHLGAARILLDAQAQPTAAYQHLYEALEEAETPAEERAARALLEGALRRRTRTIPTRLPINRA